MKSFAILLLSLAAVLVGGCGNDNAVKTPPLASELSDVASSDGLSVEMRVFKKYYEPGDKLTVVVTAGNLTDRPIRIQARSQALVFVEVQRYQNAHWARVKRYPEAAAMALRNWTLPAGETRQWTYPLDVGPDWPSAEELRLQAWLNGRPEIAPTVKVQIVPEVE
jgi:hypothetical protein